MKRLLIIAIGLESVQQHPIASEKLTTQGRTRYTLVLSFSQHVHINCENLIYFDMNKKAEFILFNRDDKELVTKFLSLGRDYFSNIPTGKREKFLQSILNRQIESDRWLFLLRVEAKYIGFVYMKIDHDERPGWGFILEFYIVPEKRRSGWGTMMYEFCKDILIKHGVEKVWLLTNDEAIPFWSFIGFRETGEIDKETGQKIMMMLI